MIRSPSESPVPRAGGRPTAPVSTSPSAPEIVAVVAGRALTRAVLDARVEAVRRGPRGRHLPPDTGADGVPGYTRWIVQELVTEAVLEHEVAEAGLGRMTLDSVVALVDRVTEDVSVPEVEIRSYYERNDDLFRDADGSPRPYAEVRAAIEAELLGAARVRAFGEWLDVRRRALAQIEPAYAHPGDPVHGLPSHRH